ncbi:PREDICTED: uncharacterized protein LOC105558581 isoform X2 [Vollenhovia emeryi]|uniref:uncharacterized protein LOC105558581 isoform X2 n=1 Tax=Vollenhovia emeryi TaxID=411798 RepID=UPI0005F3D2F3|nr:PREDICTED: uncharacterized protein LOC105558581 isoform X2 [Vollenhovia emeryi]
MQLASVSIAARAYPAHRVNHEARIISRPAERNGARADISARRRDELCGKKRSERRKTEIIDSCYARGWPVRLLITASSGTMESGGNRARPGRRLSAVHLFRVSVQGVVSAPRSAGSYVTETHEEISESVGSARKYLILSQIRERCEGATSARLSSRSRSARTITFWMSQCLSTSGSGYLTKDIDT